MSKPKRCTNNFIMFPASHSVIQLSLFLPTWVHNRLAMLPYLPYVGLVILDPINHIVRIKSFARAS